MNILVKSLLLCSCLLCSFTWMTEDLPASREAGRKTLKAGHIRYSVEIEGDQHLSIFAEEAFLNLYFNGENAKLDVNLFEGLASLQLLKQRDTDDLKLLMDIPTVIEKALISLPLDKLKITNDDYVHENTSPSTIQPHFNIIDKKAAKILGYSCYRAEKCLAKKEEGVYKIVMDMSSKVRTDINLPFNMLWDELEGIPLAMELHYPPLVIRIEAESIVKHNVKDVLFKLPDDYSTQSIKEVLRQIKSVFSKDGELKESIGL